MRKDDKACLTDRRLERAPAHHLDVGGDVLGADVANVAEAALLTPRIKRAGLDERSFVWCCGCECSR